MVNRNSEFLLIDIDNNASCLCKVCVLNPNKHCVMFENKLCLDTCIIHCWHTIAILPIAGSVTLLYNTTVHLYTNITEALVPGTISFSAQLKHTIKFLLPSHFLWRLNIVSDLVINVRMSWKGKWEPRGPKRTNWRPRELGKRRNFKRRSEKRGKNFLLVLKKRESNNKANSWF